MKMIIQRLNEIYDGTIGEFSLIDEGRILLKGYTLEPSGKKSGDENKRVTLELGTLGGLREQSSSSQGGLSSPEKSKQVWINGGCITPNQDRRIPAGLYNVAWHNSPRFKRTLPLLYNELVPKDRYILIHAGNYPKDTQGCILLGKRATREGVFNSLEALKEFLALTIGKSFKVEIFPCKF